MNLAPVVTRGSDLAMLALCFVTVLLDGGNTGSITFVARSNLSWRSGNSMLRREQRRSKYAAVL
jgi:hypothetical protein